ncbi:MAG TPA: protein kinase [Clostridia bacterium]|nr:protein kinase [Clostridia bacterium]
MDEMFLRSFLAEFDDSRYPGGFLADYEAMECLAYSDSGETLLVKARHEGTFFVAKCYTDKGLLSHTSEGELLKKLHHPGLPGYIGEYHNDHMLCVVREYIEGISLDRYAAENKLTEEQVVSFGAQLCDILSYLHGQTPPVIHRDIKPQNIIVDLKDKIRLIDFGISRVYDKSAREDTVYFGTKHFAAPEQYGFSQTDCRADIFSLGVLLGWFLTGESDIRNAMPRISSLRLRQIIRRCTAFAPDKRYMSAEMVRADLFNADGHRQKRALRWACGLLACAVCLCAGFAAGRYTDFMPVFSVPSGVSFEEPLIEQAVRLVLHKPENEPIEEKELLSVTEVYIYGDQAVGSYEAFAELGEHMAQNDGIVKNGGIRSLRDLARLKNLHGLHIALQDISKLSPLEELSSLEQIDLRHNPVEDVSPLAALPALRSLCLYATGVNDLSVLEGCSLLENIDAGGTLITSMTAFKGIEGLKYLHIRKTPIKSLAGIEEFAYLEQFVLGSVADGDLSPLLKLPKLREAHLDGALRKAAETDLKQARFRIIFL